MVLSARNGTVPVVPPVVTRPNVPPTVVAAHVVKFTSTATVVAQSAVPGAVIHVNLSSNVNLECPNRMVYAAHPVRLVTRTSTVAQPAKPVKTVNVSVLPVPRRTVTGATRSVLPATLGVRPNVVLQDHPKTHGLTNVFATAISKK